jgi:hypothetical protein
MLPSTSVASALSVTIAGTAVRVDGETVSFVTGSVLLPVPPPVE